MNEQYDKWLDKRLKNTVDSGKVEFDAEKWKQRYPAEYQALVSRARKRPHVLRALWGHPLVRIAAVVAVAAFLVFLKERRPDKQVEPVVLTKSERSPAMMMSRLSLTLAYNRGGLEEVDRQCKRAFELLGQKNTSVSINELFNESNGKESERKDL